MVATQFEFPITISDYLARLEHERAALIHTARSASRPADERPEPERWSINEVLYHLHIAEKATSRALAAVIQANERHAPKSQEELRDEWQKILRIGSDRETKFNAPSVLAPEGAPDRDEVVRLLGESRETLLEAVSSLNEDDLASLSRVHPAAGSLTLAGWLTIIAMHDLRHARQIEEIDVRA